MALGSHCSMAIAGRAAGASKSKVLHAHGTAGWRLTLVARDAAVLFFDCTVLHLFVFCERTTGPGAAVTGEEGRR